MTRDRHKALREQLQRLSEIRDSIEFVDDEVFKEIQKELILKAIQEESGKTLGENSAFDARINCQKQEIEIFFSYSDQDRYLCEQLIKHLSSLKREGMIRDWHRHQITAGEDWANEIAKHLDTAPVILLLISSDFIYSDYCYSVQLKRAIERHETRTARVIPILLRHVDWAGMPFGKLEPLPKNRCPVDSKSWHNLDEAFEHIAKGIRTAVEEMTGSL